MDGETPTISCWRAKPRQVVFGVRHERRVDIEHCHRSFQLKNGPFAHPAACSDASHNSTMMNNKLYSNPSL